MDKIKINEEQLKDGKIILLFTADWCVDCYSLKQYLPEIKKDNPEWKFLEVDTDVNMEFAQKYQIFGIPSFVAFENGKQVGELISKESKPKSLINNWIKTIGLI